MYPEAKSVGQWLRHGWHVAVAYVVGFFCLLILVGWHPQPLNKGGASAAPAPAVSTPAVATPAPPPAIGSPGYQ
jgi:hypothetical protein